MNRYAFLAVRSGVEICLSLTLLILSGCTGASTVAPVEQHRVAPVLNLSELEKNADQGLLQERSIKFPYFSDVADQLGIAFTFLNGSKGKFLMVEPTGGGASWFDFDSDGLLDLYFCQGGDPAWNSSEIQPKDELFRQIAPGQFAPVALLASIDEQQYGQGVSVGDLDDDGFDDLLVTNLGQNSLLKNQGDGTFRDMSEAVRTTASKWNTSSAWGDLDGDGDLDCYVCRYAEYDPMNPPRCINPKTDELATCSPVSLAPEPDECYFNLGDGTFSPEAHDRGLFGPGNYGLGIVIADLNNDGLPDIYVANDTTPNFLFVNQGQGQFVESAKMLGCAVSGDGLPQASMGVALGDFDHNGWLDLCCTCFTQESYTMYKNLGERGFKDVTHLVGLRMSTYNRLGFGTLMADFNQDGHEDLFFANGHVNSKPLRSHDTYRMESQLFSFSETRFIECSSTAGEYFSKKLVGRGVAKGDFDNDGDWDLVVINQNDPAAILRNDSDRGHWLKLRFNSVSNRRGIGTRVVLTQGNTTLTQELAGGTSYCIANEPALIFGLGENSADCQLKVIWPDHTVQFIEHVGVDQTLVIRQTKPNSFN